MNCMSENTFLDCQERIRPHVKAVAAKTMEDARLEAVERAKRTGNVDKHGHPLATVGVDGHWGTRSYGTNFRSKYGAVSV